jgi:hypothetical protein
MNENEWLIAASLVIRSPATLSAMNSRVTCSRSLVVTTSKVWKDSRSGIRIWLCQWALDPYLEQHMCFGGELLKVFDEV